MIPLLILKDGVCRFAQLIFFYGVVGALYSPYPIARAFLNTSGTGPPLTHG